MSKLMSMKIFCCAAETLNFSRTAANLHISPAKVSKHISFLEDHLGVKLFTRTTRQILLTEQGRSYHPKCREMLEGLEEIESAIRNDNLAVKGKLRVSLPMDFGVSVLTPLIADYLEKHPGVTLDIACEDAYVDLVGGGFDLAIRIGRQLPDSSLVARRLSMTDTVLCASPEYLEKHPQPTSPEQLTRHNCILYSHACDGHYWRLHGPDGEEVIPIKGNLRLNNGGAIRSALLNGLGIAMLPRFLVDSCLTRGSLQEVLPDYSGSNLGIYAVYPQQAYLPVRTQRFIEFLGERLARGEEQDVIPLTPNQSSRQNRQRKPKQDRIETNVA